MSTNLAKENWTALGFVLLPNLGGYGGGVFVARNKNWYRSLNKPNWTPPDWVFGPVWTALYSSMGYASYLVYRDGEGLSGPAKLPFIVYGSNVLLNWAWTPIFFGKKDPKLALCELQLVNATALATTYLFWKVNHTAGYLVIPYCLWLGIATALNYYIHKNNQGGATIEEIKEKVGSI